MKFVVIDVREPDELAAGHVPGAHNIPLGDLPGGMRRISAGKSDPIIVYCRSGRRSEAAKKLLNTAGYKNVQNGINKAATVSMLKLV